MAQPDQLYGDAVENAAKEAIETVNKGYEMGVLPVNTKGDAQFTAEMGVGYFWDHVAEDEVEMFYEDDETLIHDIKQHVLIHR